MKITASALLATLAFLSTSCAPTVPGGPLPAGVIRRGSLTNEKLMFDASVGAVAALAAKGHRIDPRRISMTAYVVSMPQGSPGSRRWTERWVFDAPGKEVPLTIDFRESGMGAADYTIRR